MNRIGSLAGMASCLMVAKYGRVKKIPGEGVIGVPTRCLGNSYGRAGKAVIVNSHFAKGLINAGYEAVVAGRSVDSGYQWHLE